MEDSGLEDSAVKECVLEESRVQYIFSRTQWWNMVCLRTRGQIISCFRTHGKRTVSWQTVSWRYV